MLAVDVSLAGEDKEASSRAVAEAWQERRLRAHCEQAAGIAHIALFADFAVSLMTRARSTRSLPAAGKFVYLTHRSQAKLL